MALVLAAASCKSAEGDREVDDEPSDAGPGDASLGDVVLPDGGGAGTIAGSADGTPFTTVATAFIAGAPDVASTTVVFLFSKPVACADIGPTGWDARIADGTQVLELKMFGKEPATFTAVTTVTPAPGEVSVNYTVASKSGTPKETGSSGGSVTLESLVVDKSAAGSFALKFGAQNLTGHFDAIHCPGGHEP